MHRMILNETSYHGSGAIKELGPEIKKRGFSKAFLVTDEGVIRAGVLEKVTAELDAAGITYTTFSDVKPNPTIENVQNGLKVLRESDCDHIVMVGGGSPQDAAKAIGIIYTNPEFEDVVSLEGFSPTKNPSLPIFAVGTTAGTASEVTINYVITDEEKKRKFVCVDPHDIPVAAFVDSDLMMSMPKGLTAATGMDALTHAIEGYITAGAWELTDCLNLKAIELIGRSLRDSVNGDGRGRENMALAQYVTGMAFSNCGLGVVHGMAHPLGSFYDIAHGVANACLLPYVMEYNAEYTGEKYRDIANALGVKGVYEMSLDDARQAAMDAVAQLARDVNIPATIKELGVKEEDIETLAELAMADACTPGNPRPCKYEEIVDLYKYAFNGRK